MNEQTTDYGTTSGRNRQNFNWALFLGCAVFALSIFIVGLVIAGKIPNSLHGNLSGSFSGTLIDGGNSSPREFMSEWEAAHFLMIPHDDLMKLIEAGELKGAYTVFQVEREVWSSAEDEEPITQRVDGNTIMTEVPQRIEYDTIIVDQLVFSRDRLTEWMLARMGG